MVMKNIIMKKNALMVCFILIAFNVFAQSNPLNDSLNKYLKIKRANIGISICEIETKDTISINGEKHYPMQSVYKFPLALIVLDAVDKKKILLSQKVHIKKSELKLKTWSPLREKYPEGEIDITVAELLEYSVSKSDNNACDILFKLIGGTTQTNNYIKKLGIKEIAIIATEEEMSKKWKLQYKNYSSPNAMNTLLKGFYKKTYLSDTSNAFLMKLMIESSNSANRIKALLPKNTIVAHKTGTSNTNKDGMRAALNDVGIITLPNGNHIVISVFISNATETYEEGEKTISEIAKIVWNYYTKNE